jgi:2-oxoglutarate dehydrogenase E1 component
MRWTLRKIGIRAGTVPANFKLYHQMAKIFNASGNGEGIKWGTAEALAFGSLLLEGNHVRITGQYVQCGTFCHRYAVVKNQNTNPQGQSGAQQTSRYWGQ